MPKEEKRPEPERIVVKTGRSTYSFTPEWTKHEGLNSILTGLIAEDLTKIKDKTEM